MKIIINGESVELPDSSGGGGSSGDAYSTEEQVIGTWIDGRPIYRRVFTGSSFQTSTTWTKLHHIAGFQELVRIWGTINYPSDNQWSPLPSHNVVLSVINGYVSSLITSGTSGTVGNPYKIVVEYTKTTDETAISDSALAAEERKNLALDMSAAPVVSMSVSSAVYNPSKEA